MCTAMKEIAEGVSLGLIKDSDVSEALLEKSLYTGNSPNPDLLVRTSGEVRLSDFLLWQTAYSCLAFVKVLWPEFSRWHLYGCILHYQRNYKQLQKAKEQNEADQIRLQRENDYEIVIFITGLTDERTISLPTRTLLHGTDTRLQQKIKIKSIRYLVTIV
ncbi:ditrans,polycis-polyprenyl diphosphate synthase, partial [Mytilus galloprovincialis]